MQKRSLTASVGQPAFVYAYEQTSLFPKVTGFVDEWKVDIGDKVKKGQVLAHIAVPELVAELQEAQQQAALDKALIDVNKRVVEVNVSDKVVAEAKARAAEENVKKFQAGVERWTSEVERLGKIPTVIDQQVLQESKKQLQENVAARDAANADAAAARATAVSRQADVEKARADVEAATVKAKVSDAHVRRLDALVGYTFVKAPYDGVVVDRNANLGDYVEPARGDYSAGRDASNQSAGQGTPLYVVAQIDKVRVYVDVPASQSAFVTPGTKARIRFQDLQGEEVEAPVTRISGSLQFRTRSLRAEVDLPNPRESILPGTYAYATLEIERKDVWAVPVAATIELGELKCVYLYEGGKAVKTPIQSGVDDGKFVELYRKEVNGKWMSFDGNEQVIQGDLSELSNGREVEVERP
jgi:multidrug efflux pump subunit AcrA (membrane-fusion protein)